MIDSFIETVKGNSLKSHLIRGGIGNVIIRAIYSLLTFLISILLTRFMGASIFGVFSYFTSVLAVLSIPSQLGMPLLIIRETAQALELKLWGKIKGLWQWSAWLALLMSIIFAIGSYAVVFIAKIPLTVDQQGSMEWGLILLPLSGICALVGAALRGIDEVNLSQFPERLFLPGIFALLIVVAHYFGKIEMTSTEAFRLQVIAAAIASGGGILLLYFKTPKPVIKSVPEYESKRWLPSAIVLALNSGIQAINKQLSVIILGLFVVSSEVGVYRIAVQMALLVDIGFNVINPVIASQFARLYLLKDQRRLQLLATKSARIVLLFNLVITIAFVLFGKLFLLIVYGKEFIPAYTSLLILLVGQMVNSLAGSIGYLMNMTGFEGTNTMVRIVATVINIGLNFLLTPFFGAIGAAIGTSVSIIVWNVWLCIEGIKKVGINSSVFGKV